MVGFYPFSFLSTFETIETTFHFFISLFTFHLGCYDALIFVYFLYPLPFSLYVLTCTFETNFDLCFYFIIFLFTFIFNGTWRYELCLVQFCFVNMNFRSFPTFQLTVVSTSFQSWGNFDFVEGNSLLFRHHVKTFRNSMVVPILTYLLLLSQFKVMSSMQ